MKTKNILITGSEGNVGRTLVPYLKQLGHKVMCIDIQQKYRNDYVLCDITNLSDAEPFIDKFKPDVVFHLAAMVSRVTSEKSPHTSVNINIAGTSNIALLCVKHNALLINFSTSEVYGNNLSVLDETCTPNPNNIYGLTKYIAEQVCNYHHQNNSLKVINVRPFMLYDEYESFGENRSVMIRFAENILLGKPITVHRGAFRSWLHMDDAVIMFEELIHLNQYATINIGNPVFSKIEDLATLMCRYAKQPETLIQKSELPKQMTLSKLSGFEVQKKLITHRPQIDLAAGVIKVMDKVKHRLQCESVI